MRYYFILFLCFEILCLSIADGQQTQDSIRWFEMRGTEIRDVHSKITNQDYELIIQPPYSYKKDTSKRYPVVYFCDGFYDFALFAMIYGDQIYDKTINECFLVGFSYKGENLDYGKLRTHDYTPTSQGLFSPGGGAPDFLKVVEQEFIPFVENNYRVDPSFRAMGGSSLGGLFTLYAMFTRPNLFHSYMAISPAVTWDNDWLFGYEDKFHELHPDLPISLYMTAAEKEWPDFVNGIQRFDEVLRKHSYQNFRYKFRILDDAYHAGSKPEGYTRGMQFIFAPLLENK
jgi:predicted alpha/beta superfamily hydrolase